MKPVTVEKLAKVLNAGPVQIAQAGGVTVTGVSIDSRTIKPGNCFFAVKGENLNGHDYIDKALANGAVCAVAKRKYQSRADSDGIILRVDDTTKALGDLARWYRKTMPFKVVAITGSAGKTTTREIIHHVLRQHFSCYQAPKSFNNNIGLPLSLLGAEEHHEIVMVELGSSRSGEIAHLAEIASPDIAVITNIYPAHLEGFGSIEAIIKEKASICEALAPPPEGKLLVNGDFPGLLEYCRSIGREFITFGETADCDIRGGSLYSNGVCGELTIDGCKVSVPLAGKANLANTLAAWALCRQFGISAADFAEAVKTIEPVKMRLETQDFGDVTVINDCYNANPASMANALDYLASFPKTSATSGQNAESVGKKRRLVFICGPMAELGTQSGNLHAELGELISAGGIQLLLATGPFAEMVIDRANRNGDDMEGHIFEDTDALCDNLQQFIRPGDIILVKGSRCGRLEKAVEKLKELFG